MRSGDLAAMVGVSTRTVRHYHHIGLLPEPARLANGYRECHLRDAVLLVRVRRLTELGLSLDEIRDTLHDDEGRDLREVLLELDADLARQQVELAARRQRLADLLAQQDLNADSTVSPELAAVLRGMPAAQSRTARLDRDLLALADGVADADQRPGLAELAADLIDHLPDAVRSVMAVNLDSQDAGQWLALLSQELSNAQVEVFRQAATRVEERGSC